MSKKELNEEFFNERYIKKPVFVPESREWKVQLVEKGKWIDKFFNNETRALSFYLDKLKLFKFWVMSEFKENTK